MAFLKVYATGYGSQVPVAEPTTWDATVGNVTSAVLDRVRIRIDPGNAAGTPGEVDDIRTGPTGFGLFGAPDVEFVERLR